MITFYQSHIFTGGAETLIYRIAEELLARGRSVEIVCKTCSDNMKALFAEDDIPLHENQNCYNAVIRSDTLIVFFLIDYVKFKLLSVGRNTKVLFYMVNLDTLAAYRLQRYPLLFRLFKPILSSYLAHEIRGKNIIFMDRLGINFTEQFYQTSYGLTDSDMFPLPVDVFPLQDDFCKKVASNRAPFSILSIARADFPFKGYLKGLLEICTQLCRTYPIQLTIISYGADINRLHQWIDTAKDSGFSDITLIGETPYHELERYILSSNLYIGMGTTVLDAAARGIPAIAVQSHTYALNAYHLFWEEPGRIGGDPAETIPPAQPLIERVLRMSDTEYIDTMKRTEHALRELYSMDSFMAKFLPLIG